MKFVRQLKPKLSDDAEVIIFYQDKLLINNKNKRFIHPCSEFKLFFDINDLIAIAVKDNKTICTVDITENLFLDLDEYDFVDLRMILGSLNQESFSLIGRSKMINYWKRNNQFCGVCGNKTKFNPSEEAFQRPCNKEFIYPKISPCIITLIHRGDEILLGRSKHFPKGMFSTLAGFIEPGESCEEALVREVKEEVGINVKNIKYFSSQNWPFPSQLMIGYFAEYDSGEIILEDEEIEEAYWFNLNKLPSIPPEGSISGLLIRSYIEDHS